jgi:hypothetical protein
MSCSEPQAFTDHRPIKEANEKPAADGVRAG